MADAQIWAKRVAAWKSSGQTAAVFSARSGLVPSTLKWWASRLRRREGARFVHVLSVAAPRVAERESAIEIEVAGVRVLVRRDFDRASLTMVLDVVRGGST